MDWNLVSNFGKKLLKTLRYKLDKLLRENKHIVKKNFLQNYLADYYWINSEYFILSNSSMGSTITTMVLNIFAIIH